MPIPTRDWVNLLVQASETEKTPVVGFETPRKVYGFCNCGYEVAEAYIFLADVEEADNLGQMKQVLKDKQRTAERFALANCWYCAHSELENPYNG